MVSYLLVAGATLLELLCTIFVINGLVGEKPAYPAVWIKMIYLGITTGFIMLVPEQWSNGSYILVFLFVYLVYRRTWKESFIVTVLSLIIVGIIELICMFPIVFLLKLNYIAEVNNLLGAIIALLLCTLLIKTVPLYHLKKWCSKKEVLYIAVVIFSLILVLTTIIDYHMTLRLELADYLYISVCVLIMWLLGLRLMKYRYEEEIQKDYLEAFSSVIDQMKRRQHKFRNQMDAVYSLHKLYNDYDSLVQAQCNYLGKLADYEMPTDVLVLKKPIIIAHVFEKITEAQEAGIKVNMRLTSDLADCKIQDIQMIEILGTLFDNAIQDMIKSKCTHYLLFEVKKTDLGVMISIGNPHEKISTHDLERMFENGYSTKGENRGIGLYHLKQLVKKQEMELMVENKCIADQNYIYFSVVLGEG